MKSSSPSPSLSVTTLAAATAEAEAATTQTSSSYADADILMALRTAAAAAAPVAAISNNNSPAGSTTTSPLLAPALPFLMNPNVAGVGLVAPQAQHENNNLSLVVGRYANIIRAQALVRSMYELEQARAAERNERLLRAVVASGTTAASAANARNAISISGGSEPVAGFISKPTPVKANAGRLFSSSKLKFRHYGKHKHQQQTTTTTKTPHRGGYMVPMTMMINNENKLQKQKHLGVHQPQKLKPLEPPPMLWKPTHMVQGLKNADANSSNIMETTEEKTLAVKVKVKAVSPITTGLARPRPASSK